MKTKVTVKQTSNDGKGEVQEIVWSVGDEVAAMLSLAQLMQHAVDDSPWAPRMLSVNIEFI